MTGESPMPHETDRLVGWIRDHGRAVRGYVLAMVRRADVADDLAQDVFRRAWQARDRYRDMGQSRAYLLKIADRLVCDWARGARREITLADESWRHIEPESRNAPPEERLAREEKKRELAEALDRLSPPQRRVLLLRYYGEMSFSEIARIMNCPLNTALSHCRRGLLALRTMLVEETS